MFDVDYFHSSSGPINHLHEGCQDWFSKMLITITGNAIGSKTDLEFDFGVQVFQYGFWKFYVLNLRLVCKCLENSSSHCCETLFENVPCMDSSSSNIMRLFRRLPTNFLKKQKNKRRTIETQNKNLVNIHSIWSTFFPIACDRCSIC